LEKAFDTPAPESLIGRAENGRLPPVFEDNLNGAVVVLTLHKKPGKDIRMKSVYLVERNVEESNVEESA
jgi:hypothetical protein